MIGVFAIDRGLRAVASSFHHVAVRESMLRLLFRAARLCFCFDVIDLFLDLWLNGPRMLHTPVLIDWARIRCILSGHCWTCKMSVSSFNTTLEAELWKHGALTNAQVPLVEARWPLCPYHNERTDTARCSTCTTLVWPRSSM